MTETNPPMIDVGLGWLLIPEDEDDDLYEVPPSALRYESDEQLDSGVV